MAGACASPPGAGRPAATRVAVYARVSTADQSCEPQLRDLRQYVAARGWQAVEYIDQGVSGARDRRPGLDRLLAAVKARKVDVLVVAAFDRFGRSVRHLVETLEVGPTEALPKDAREEYSGRDDLLRAGSSGHLGDIHGSDGVLAAAGSRVTRRARQECSAQGGFEVRNSILACVLGAVMSLYGRSALAQTSTTTSTATTAPPSTTTTTIPGSCCGPATCGMVIKVDATNNNLTLYPAASDPIFSGPCSGNGITVINKGRNAVNQSFTIDCQNNQSNPITGSPTGIGIMLKGVNLSVFNCYVDGFGIGIASNGDGSDIEDSQVQNATGDGFYVKSRVKITNLNIIGVTFTGNRAYNNGGWGFNMPANEIFGGTGSNFNCIADTNGKGGFYVKGDGNALSGSEAFNNGGPGFLIISKSCCSGSAGQSFDTAAASSNVGPGIVYEARDDGSNCVGGSGPSCTGGTFYPTGFDTTPGGISAADNGPCPPGSLPFQNGNGVCPIVLGAPCSQAVLNRCP